MEESEDFIDDLLPCKRGICKYYRGVPADVVPSASPLSLVNHGGINEILNIINQGITISGFGHDGTLRIDKVGLIGCIVPCAEKTFWECATAYLNHRQHKLLSARKRSRNGS